MHSRPSISIVFAVLRSRVGSDAALRSRVGSDAALECNCSLVCGRALRSGSSHSCSLESSWLLGDDYVSKALVGIILNAFWPSAALLL